MTHNAGKVTRELAQEHAEGEFEKYAENRRQIEATEPTSDFDKMVLEKMKDLESSGKQPSRKRK